MLGLSFDSLEASAPSPQRRGRYVRLEQLLIVTWAETFAGRFPLSRVLTLTHEPSPELCECDANTRVAPPTVRSEGSAPPDDRVTTHTPQKTKTDFVLRTLSVHLKGGEDFNLNQRGAERRAVRFTYILYSSRYGKSFETPSVL